MCRDGYYGNAIETRPGAYEKVMAMTGVQVLALPGIEERRWKDDSDAKALIRAPSL